MNNFNKIFIKLRRMHVFFIPALFICSILLPDSAFAKKGRDMYVYFLDVGQGDAVFIKTPSGKNILIDGGPAESAFDAGKEIIIPFLKRQNVRKIDVIVATHPHGDHIGGLVSVLKEISVGEVLDTGFVYPSPYYERFMRVINSKKIKYKIVQKDDKLNWDPALSVKVLSPRRNNLYEDPNNNSIVIRMVYNDISFLLTGDMEDIAEYDVVSNYRKDELSAIIMKVAHHGSTTSSTDIFLETVQPEVAIICVGRLNRFHLPRKSILKRYEDYGIELHRTDKEGTIFISTDGETYALQALGFAK